VDKIRSDPSGIANPVGVRKARQNHGVSRSCDAFVMAEESIVDAR
jgi:hypothetical protein